MSTTTKRLQPDTLDALAADVGRPGYDRDRVVPGIVHLGVGAFHRVHEAVYTDDVLALDPGWGIVGVSLRSPDMRDALEPQDGLYTLAVRGSEGESLRVIGSIVEMLVAPEDPQVVLERMTRAAVRIVSLTVTEKGYCYDAARGALREDHDGIRHDLSAPDQPVTAIGFLVEALARRRAAGIAPFTALSCDNLSHNGDVLKAVLVRFATLRDPELGAWIADTVACPNTMVDRIAPATTPADRESIARRLGVDDAWPVVTEPFSQWVVEDVFPTGRPAWDKAGATMTADVAAFEKMKLRLLNASHTLMAYLGTLAGFEYVSDAISDPAMAAIVAEMMDEVTPTLKVPPGADLDAYKAALIVRFGNPTLKHRLLQIAMDGSQKLPQRQLAAIRDRLAAGAAFPRLALAVAAWIAFVADRTAQGMRVDDPLADVLFSAASSAGPGAAALARALFGVTAVFGDDLPDNPLFVETVTAALERILSEGARAVLTRG